MSDDRLATDRAAERMVVWLEAEADACMVPDEEREGFIDSLLNTVGAHLRWAELIAVETGDHALLAQVDQTRAVMREGAMRVIRQHFNEIENERGEDD